jgi:hypothetical protein
MRSKLLMVAMMVGSVVGCAADDGATGRLESELTTDDCMQSVAGGTDAVCHWADTQYIRIVVAEQACLNAHAANHPQDFIDTTGDCSCVGAGQGVQTAAPCCGDSFDLDGTCVAAGTDICKTYMVQNPGATFPASCKEYQDSVCQALAAENPNLTLPGLCGPGA